MGQWQFAALSVLCSAVANAEVKQFPGGKELPHEKYIRVVGESVSPVQQVYVKTKDGLYVAVGESIITSPDGAAWTVRQASTSPTYLSGVAYGNGGYVAVGKNGY